MSDVKFLWQEPVPVSMIASSWEAAFKRKFDFAEWEWRFKCNLYETDNLASYISVNGQIASYYAISPLVLVTPDSDKLKTGLMVAGLTHPDFRSKGYFVQTIDKLNGELSERGFAYIFAFANNNSHYSVRKHLNWQDVGITTNFRLNRTHKKFLNTSQDTTVVGLDLTEELISQISDFAVCSGKYHLERSKEYLNWRILQHPTRNYLAAGVYEGRELKAVLIYKAFNETEMDIMEIFWADRKDIASEKVLTAMISFLLENKATAINIWSNLYSEEHLVLEKIGFIEEKFSAYYGIIKLSNQSVSSQIADWHYRFLDSDVY